MKLSDWEPYEGNCWVRYTNGKNTLQNRVALIQKSARVRVAPMDPALCWTEDSVNWESDGARYTPEGNRTEAKAVCDAKLKSLGYEV